MGSDIDTKRMSIHFISGKPGGGKSLYGMKMVLDELLYGNRTVITNLPIKLPELNEYLQREYPNKTVNLHDRVILFDEDEMKGFFTLRPKGSVGPKLLTKDEWKMGSKPDYSGVCDSGVFYVVDEVHIGFNSRAWMDTGADVLYYLSQHRKLGDTVVCITQAINNVDKQFRSVTQDFTYIRNLSKEKLSAFRLPSLFIRQTFNVPATDNAQPMETGTFRLDVKGLASCYDTAKGVGIHGRSGADARERKTGLHWSVFVVGALLLVYLLAYQAPKLVVKLFDHKPQKKNAIPQTQTNSAPTQIPPVETRTTNEPQRVTIQLPRGNLTNTPPEVVVEVLHKLKGYWEVFLSDGSRFTQHDPELEQISVSYVQISGHRYKYARPGTCPAETRYGGEPPAPMPVTITRVPRFAPTEEQRGL